MDTELEKEKNQKFTVVLSFIKQNTASTWPLEKGICCKMCFPAQSLGLHPIIMCTCPCCVPSLTLKTQNPKKTHLHIHCTAPSTLPATFDNLLKCAYTLITGSTLLHLVTPGIKHLM